MCHKWKHCVMFMVVTYPLQVPEHFKLSALRVKGLKVPEIGQK